VALLQIGLPIVVIYVMADGGSVAGAWLSSFLSHRGKTVNAARKIAVLICAIRVLPIVFIPQVASTLGAVFLSGLATAAHHGFSTKLFTLPSDMFPIRAVAAVVGIGGMAGAIGGGLMAKVVAYFPQWTGSYRIPFLIAEFAYLVALGAIHVLAPRLEGAMPQAADNM
jgi:MFS transporter, ACS family, hexuronate transporter